MITSRATILHNALMLSRMPPNTKPRLNGESKGTIEVRVCDTPAARDTREWNAVDLRILGVEPSLFVGGVAHTQEGVAHNMFAEQLRT
jgi:hypothetical protein